MKTVTVIFLVLSTALVRADTNASITAVQSEEDAYIREYEEHDAAIRQVHELIKAGRLKEAEKAVEQIEPNYARKWSMGRFGYGTRMEIAQVYLDQGDKAQAMRLFKAAKPGGGCGNCMASQHVHRNIRIARLHESRLNFPAAFLSYLDALPSTSLGGGFFRVVWGLGYTAAVTITPVVAVLLFVRHRRRQARINADGQPSAGANGLPPVAQP